MGLPRNPVAEVERPRYRVSDDLDAFSAEEVWALVRAAASDQDAALFLTAAFTGLRMGELLALQWRDVDFAGEAIRVRRSYNIHGGVGTPKSGTFRSVPLGPEAARALARLGEREEFAGDDELVFAKELGRFMDASALRDRYREPSRARDFVRSDFTISRTRSGHGPCGAPRSPRSKPGWGTPTSRRRLRYVHHRDRGNETKLLAPWGASDYRGDWWSWPSRWAGRPSVYRVTLTRPYR